MYPIQTEFVLDLATFDQMMRRMEILLENLGQLKTDQFQIVWIKPLLDLWYQHSEHTYPILEIEREIQSHLDKLPKNMVLDPKIADAHRETIKQLNEILKMVHGIKSYREPFFQIFFIELFPLLETRFVGLAKAEFNGRKIVSPMESQFFDRLSKLFERSTFNSQSDELKTFKRKTTNHLKLLGECLKPISNAIQSIDHVNEANKIEYRTRVESVLEGVSHHKKQLNEIFESYQQISKNLHYESTDLVKLALILQESIQIESSKQWSDANYKEKRNQLKVILSSTNSSIISNEFLVKKGELLTILNEQDNWMNTLDEIEDLLLGKRQSFEEVSGVFDMDDGKSLPITRIYDETILIINSTYEYLTNVGLTIAFAKINELLQKLNDKLKNSKKKTAKHFVILLETKLRMAAHEKVILEHTMGVINEEASKLEQATRSIKNAENVNDADGKLIAFELIQISVMSALKSLTNIADAMKHEAAKLIELAESLEKRLQ